VESQQESLKLTGAGSVGLDRALYKCFPALHAVMQCQAEKKLNDFISWLPVLARNLYQYPDHMHWSL